MQTDNAAEKPDAVLMDADLFRLKVEAHDAYNAEATKHNDLLCGGSFLGCVLLGGVILAVVTKLTSDIAPLIAVVLIVAFTFFELQIFRRGKVVTSEKLWELAVRSSKDKEFQMMFMTLFQSKPYLTPDDLKQIESWSAERMKKQKESKILHDIGLYSGTSEAKQ